MRASLFYRTVVFTVSFMAIFLTTQVLAPVTVVRPAFRPIIVASGSGCDSVNDASLMAYWRLDEASGTREDTKGANDLTDNNTVTSAAGKIGNAAQFTAANNESLSITDNADLSSGDIDFWIHAWVYWDGVAGFQTICGKTGITDEYLLYSSGTALFFSTGGGASVTSSTTLSTGTWYCIDAWFQASDNSIHITVNAGSENTTTGAAPADGVSMFRIGDYGGVFYFGGRIEEVFFSKRLPTSDERTALYNSGSGCRPTGL